MDETKWNSIVSEAGGDFMQSMEWGAFQRALGREVVHVDAGGMLSQAYVRPLGYGKEQLYIPMGPVPYKTSVDGKEHLSSILHNKTDSTLFVECDLLTHVPGLEPSGGETRQPKMVSIVDIEGKNKESIYNRFHETLKENIVRASRYNLVVKKEEGWEGFFELYEQTMERHKLRPWGREYIKKLWETLRPHGMIEIWSCYVANDLLASNLYILFNGRSTHLFGGTSAQKRETMAPHFLHLSMMDTYAQRGFKDYDLGKVDPKGLKNLSDFKERFGGRRKTYPGNYRYIVKPFWYKLYTLAKR